MAMEAPVVLATEASVMLRPPRHLVRTYGVPDAVLQTAYGVPDAVLRTAYGPGSQSRQDAKDSLSKVRNLLVELGLVTPAAKRLWQRLGIWDEA
jgi:hypothetical protein